MHSIPGLSCQPGLVTQIIEAAFGSWWINGKKKLNKESNGMMGRYNKYSKWILLSILMFDLLNVLDST